jgi:hypothetical protein
VDGREGFIHEKLVAVARSGGTSRARTAGTGPSIRTANLYGSSWAVVVGINDYQIWPALHYAVNNPGTVRSKLLDLGFEPAKIFQHYNRDATKENSLRIVDGISQRIPA